MKRILKEYRNPAELTATRISETAALMDAALLNAEYNKAKLFAEIIRTLSEALYFMGEGKK